MATVGCPARTSIGIDAFLSNRTTLCWECGDTRVSGIMAFPISETASLSTNGSSVKNKRPDEQFGRPVMEMITVAS